MSGEKKAFELQMQVRQNAREYQSSVKDLYSWEKEIKSKEQALKNAPAPAPNTASAVRSHVTKENETSNKKPKHAASPVGTPTEKQDLPVDTVAQQHKKANDIKDRGNSYVKVGDYERAIEAYTEAIETYAHDPVYFINRALCYLKQERYDHCVDDCEAAIAIDKTCVKAYYRRMQANESLGNNMEALKDCTTVLAIDPKNIEAKRSLQRINDRLRKIATKSGPNFNAARDDLVDILPFDKPAYKRSKKAMRRMPIVDIVSPRANQEEPNQLRITDEEIDKIFNSNCGPFEEVKKTAKPKPVVQESKKTIDVPAEATKSAATPKVEKVETKQDVKTTTATKITEQSVKVVEKTVESNTEKKLASNKSESKDKPAPSNNKNMERIPMSPAGTAQFYITWKELSPTQKYQYLKSIEIPNLCKILGAGFDSETYADLLLTLQDYYVPNKEPTTAAVLHEISKNDEFTILAMLMSPEEKKTVTTIMNEIKKFPNNNATLWDKIAKAYNVT
ncbi:RNA polymerase II-associated protein 3 [Drosophila busckii]|uniref:RNA polymerase II-associated protein 3 n=1 Tax=Drosophila busckii TaxID=30019 RepID=UPI00083EBEA8|nr:RNA polymerase II-associated protein 3 [Drosophila busckii]